MSKASRDKGKRGEREIVNTLQEIVDAVCDEFGEERILLQRNLLQWDAGGCDLHGLEWLSLECKRVEKEAIGSWWRQTLAQVKGKQTPVLVHRASRQPWRVRMRVPVKAGQAIVTMTVDTDFDSFLVYFRERMRHEMKREALAKFARGERVSFSGEL